MEYGIFTSPETCSEYRRVTYGDTFVCYRTAGAIEDGQVKAIYRIRIQGTEAALKLLQGNLSGKWSGVKDGDHLSVDVTGKENLAHAVGQAVAAIIATL